MVEKLYIYIYKKNPQKINVEKARVSYGVTVHLAFVTITVLLHER